MNTFSKVLLWTVVVLTLPVLYFAAVTLHKQNQWRTSLDNPTVELEAVQLADLTARLEEQIWSLPPEPSDSAWQGAREQLSGYRDRGLALFESAQRALRRSPRLNREQRKSFQDRLSQLRQGFEQSDQKLEQAQDVGQLQEVAQRHVEQLESLVEMLNEGLPTLGLNQQAVKRQWQLRRIQVLVARFANQIDNARYSWGRGWTDVTAAWTEPWNGDVSVEVGAQQGLPPQVVLSAFVLGDPEPVYLGDFQVRSVDANSAQLVISPHPDANGNGLDEVEQQMMEDRRNLLERAKGQPWVLRTDLPEGLHQQIEKLSQLVAERRAYVHSAEKDRDTWLETLTEAKQTLARREQDLRRTVVEVAHVEDERSTAVANLHRVRQQLAYVENRFSQLTQQNKQLAHRLSELEELLVSAAREGRAVQSQ